jgi:serine protease AprX
MLAQDPRVASISPDRAIHGSMDIAYESTGAAAAHQRFGVTGEHVTVAVVDSGIVPSAEIPASRILAAVDFVDSTSTQPVDPYGHGTHIAGIIGAAQNAVVPGIAPGVSFVSLRVLDAQGSGSVSSAIRAIDWAIEHRRTLNIRVMNLSIGHPIAESFRTDPLTRAVERAWQAGIVVVVAAGNGGRQKPGYFTIESPGNDPRAHRGRDERHEHAGDGGRPMATYSSRGPSFGDHVLKPGPRRPGQPRDRLALRGRQPAGSPPPRPHPGEGPDRASGTSMSAAMVRAPRRS